MYLSVEEYKRIKEELYRRMMRGELTEEETEKAAKLFDIVWDL